MSLLKSILNGDEHTTPDEERVPITCNDGTRILVTENGSLLEKKVTHVLIEVLKLEGPSVPIAWRTIPYENTYHGISAQSLKRFITAHGGEHELLTSWYNTWKEIRAEYRANEHGIVTDPGKFEGEMLYVPFFWQATLGGCADTLYWDSHTERTVDQFCLDGWKIIFPAALIESSLLDDEKSYLLLWETDQGFVNTEIKTKSELPVSG